MTFLLDTYGETERDREKERERERENGKSRPHARTRRGYRFHVFPFGNCLVFFYTPRRVCVCVCVSGHGGKIDTISRYLEPSRSGWSPKSDHALCESALIRAPSTRHGAVLFSSSSSFSSFFFSFGSTCITIARLIYQFTPSLFSRPLHRYYLLEISQSS